MYADQLARLNSTESNKKFPIEVWTMIFRTMDVVSATAFSLASKDTKALYDLLSPEVFGTTTHLPIPISTTILCQIHLRLDLKVVLRTWIPEQYFWDNSKKVFVTRERFIRNAARAIRKVKERKDEYKQKLIDRAEARDEQEQEKEEHEKEQEELYESRLESYRQQEWDDGRSTDFSISPESEDEICHTHDPTVWTEISKDTFISDHSIAVSGGGVFDISMKEDSDKEDSDEEDSDDEDTDMVDSSEEDSEDEDSEDE